MTTPSTPALKSLTPTTDQPRPAEPAAAPAAGGAPKVAAEGVPSAVRPDSRPGPGPRVIGWLHIITPRRRGDIPRAISHCGCGRHLTAQGRAQVLALIADHATHRTLCALHTAPERKQAA